MGMSPACTATATTRRASRPSTPRSSAASTCSTPATSTASGKNELLIGRALAGRPPRPGPALREVRRACAAPTAPSSASTPARRRSKNFARLQPDPARRRPHRHLPAGAPRSGGADRGHDRRDRRPGEGRLRPPHRPVRGRRRDASGAPPRSTRSRPADRVLAGQPRARGGRSSRCSPSSASRSPPTACCRAACSPAASRPAPGDFRAHLPRFAGENGEKNQRPGRRAGPPGRRARRHAGAARHRLGARQGRRPDDHARPDARRPHARPARRRARRASTSRSAPTRSPRWRRRCPRPRSPARATRRRSWRTLDSER